MGADRAIRVSVPAIWAEVVGVSLFDFLGPYQELEEGQSVHLIFYPFRHGAGYVPDKKIRASISQDKDLQGSLKIERLLVPEGWEDSWKRHFVGTTVGRLHIRPPWEDPPAAGGAGEDGLLDIVLTPGLAFGTGLHATTRGVLELMQDGGVRGPLVDAGTGCGILSVAAAILGFAPVYAFDSDPLSVEAARANAASNDVDLLVEGVGVDAVSLDGWEEKTILANITVEPVLELLSRMSKEKRVPRRLVVSGILEGKQADRILEAAGAIGLQERRHILAQGWRSMDFSPQDAGG